MINTEKPLDEFMETLVKKEEFKLMKEYLDIAEEFYSKHSKYNIIALRGINLKNAEEKDPMMAERIRTINQREEIREQRWDCDGWDRNYLGKL